VPPVTPNSAAREATDSVSGRAAVVAVTPNLDVRPAASDLREARRYVPNASAEEQAAFAERQLRARSRATLLLDFYRRYPCHLAELHLLAACAVALGRFRASTTILRAHEILRARQPALIAAADSLFPHVRPGNEDIRAVEDH